MVNAHAKALAIAMFATAACATVAGVEVTRPSNQNDNDNSLRQDDAAATNPAAIDSGPTSKPPPDAGTINEGVACGCDAGQACCIGVPAGCVGQDVVCTGLRLACRQTSDDGRDCCWNESDAGVFEATSYRAGCGVRERVSCLKESDCVPYGGGACLVTVCSGVTIGVCAQGSGAAPTCL